MNALVLSNHPDAELIKLGKEFRRMRQAQIDLYDEVGDDESPETIARIDESERELGALSNRILAIEPKTVDGLRTVALCYANCHKSGNGTWDVADNACHDTRAVYIVMRWLVDGGAS
ncbi:hypothetical protein EET67_22460 [Pseudaminobacter arsenicus]|uniref:Uncharacterized protein n=1 Tax=Borborobacter arsenicus TaxID=1851146 RepID=A0A432V0I7_9HYPH|nr:hypothetical protein [Pseudaminobacter arsenicus]RUM95595.1 hypothetical protein EET67_22460 [Pseudaminobacter arsenicus]